MSYCILLPYVLYCITSTCVCRTSENCKSLILQDKCIIEIFLFFEDCTVLHDPNKVMKVHLSVPYNPTGISVSDISICLFNWILYIPSTIFHLCMDGSSCVDPVLIKAMINVSCSRTQHIDAGEAQTHSPSVPRQALYH